MFTLHTELEAVGVMKALKYLIGSAFALTMVSATPALAVDLVAGSSHDLSVPAEEICVYCHTPHNGNTAIPAPLWNRDMVVTSFAMYASPTLNMSIAADPQAISLACLSCHDGVTAYNNIVQGTASNIGVMVAPFAVGLDGLGNDHPISITYDIVADTAFNAATGIGAPGANVGGLPLFDRVAGSNDQVECATCHNPHEATNPSFLRATNVQSDLCTTCHIK
ncbi:MAG: cytochrome c3 family protein [Proteobacteria bacterium]|nr:cytochrome c3 family protein [Pseudomonadota bacterium]